jgi:hypothetical protein
LVHTFEIILRTNIQFEVRKRVHRKLTILTLLYIVRYQQRKKKGSFLTSNKHCEQPSFHIGMGSYHWQRKFHDEHHNRLKHYSANESCAQLPWLHIQFEVTGFWHPKSLFLNVDRYERLPFWVGVNGVSVCLDIESVPTGQRANVSRLLSPFGNRHFSNHEFAFNIH